MVVWQLSTSHKPLATRPVVLCPVATRAKLEARSSWWLCASVGVLWRVCHYPLWLSCFLLSSQILSTGLWGTPSSTLKLSGLSVHFRPLESKNNNPKVGKLKQMMQSSRNYGPLPQLFQGFNLLPCLWLHSEANETMAHAKRKGIFFLGFIIAQGFIL